MFLIAQKLPYFIKKRLFGDRKKHGIKVDEHDEEWGMWLEQYNNNFIPILKLRNRQVY